jgi:hypothetical protein
LNGIVLHGTHCPKTELCRFLEIFALRIGDEGLSTANRSLLAAARPTLPGHHERGIRTEGCKDCYASKIGNRLD